MKKKRILCILLAAMLLFTMDGGSLYAMGISQEQQYEEDKQDMRTAPEEGENSPEEGEEPPEEGETPPGEGEEPPEEEQEYTVNFELNGGVTVAGTNSFSLRVKEGEAIAEIGRAHV